MARYAKNTLVQGIVLQKMKRIMSPFSARLVDRKRRVDPIKRLARSKIRKKVRGATR